MKLVAKLKIALTIYSPNINNDIATTLSKFIPVKSPSVITSVRSANLLGPIMEHTELKIPIAMAVI